MLEASNLKAIWMAACAAASGLRMRLSLFRTNSGKAWVPSSGRPQRLANGDMLIPGGRPVALGLGLVSGDPVPGQSDLQGWLSVEITPAMVGQRVAVYTAIECKRTDGGVTSGDQKNFVQQVVEAGGIAGVANTPAVAQAIIHDWADRMGAEIGANPPAKPDRDHPKMIKERLHSETPP